MQKYKGQCIMRKKCGAEESSVDVHASPPVHFGAIYSSMFILLLIRTMALGVPVTIVCARLLATTPRRTVALCSTPLERKVFERGAYSSR